MQTLVNDGRTNYPLTLNVDDLGDGYDVTALAQIDARSRCAAICRQPCAGWLTPWSRRRIRR